MSETESQYSNGTLPLDSKKEGSAYDTDEFVQSSSSSDDDDDDGCTEEEEEQDEVESDDEEERDTDQISIKQEEQTDKDNEEDEEDDEEPLTMSQLKQIVRGSKRKHKAWREGSQAEVTWSLRDGPRPDKEDIQLYNRQLGYDPSSSSGSKATTIRKRCRRPNSPLGQSETANGQRPQIIPTQNEQSLNAGQAPPSVVHQADRHRFTIQITKI
ncbi:uncharacterized protein I303_104808 [Kwoniella dejecticola CBS 10117]|uniref:Uncharacterized protein n=1 Tax=Kwoniella dejecticola CBS 10117 TaxID=1296121 RepID=A0A1A6A4A8_9TREE|nr:uncharacterized protein I303_04211 [Kwoniella dejecticola CBS 10117]OBR84889.1 hypothetical protein I303_04211 [Kwoniella dejecticola CBS 10117]